MDKFVLIDGNSLINRGFYATPPMSSSKGEPTNAVYAFCNMLIKIITDINPKYMLVAFDRREPTFRHALFTDYKGTRKPSPPDLHPQIETLKNVLDAMDIKRFELAGFEADDIIGTIAHKFQQVETVIITGDKDSFQLVDDNTCVYFTKRGITELDVYNHLNFKEKMGINPIQIIDLKALMGDSSDNIPGVKGVGEKTAINLIQTYNSIENLYENVNEIKGKLFEKLVADKDNSFLSKKLATINTQVPIEGELESYVFPYPFDEKVKEIFSRLELRNLLKKENIFVESVKENSFVKEVETVEIFDEKFFMSLIKNDKIVVNISDYINFYVFDNFEYKLKIKENFFDDGFEAEEAISLLKPIFEDENKTIILFYKNQTRHLLNKHNISFKAKCYDVSIMKYLVDFTGKDVPLNDVFLDHNLNAKTPAFSLSQLFEEYFSKMNEDDLALYNKIELPLCDVLYDMEVEGFAISESELYKMGEKFSQELKEVENKIFELAGEKFNVSSPKQLGVILFEKLNLKHGKKNKNGYSTSADVLEALENEHPIIPLILKYRQLSKINSTYIEGYKRLIDKKTGVVHTTFNQVQTATGRLSSREPNLQNIPVRDEIGREIRKLFKARDNDHILIDADYSQIELRLLAHFSKSQTLIDAFNNGVDIHSVTASQVFGVELSQVTKEMRSTAKAVNFGIIYGISDFGLAKNVKCSVKTAREYIAKYFEMYPKIKEYMNFNVESARKNGYAITLFNRRRYIREINSQNYNLRQFGERAAMNMPLQGTAADIIKIAMINVHKKLIEGGYKSKLILQVHDELIIDALKSEAEEVKNLLKFEMENAVKLSVPLDVDVSVCENWYDAK